MEATKWKKGQSGNLAGGRKHSPEIKALRNLTEEEMVEIGSLVVKGSIEELRAIKNDPNASALKCMMASVAIKTIATGNAQALDILLNRLVGKARDRVEIVSNNQTNLTAAIGIVDEERIKSILDKIRSDV